MEMDTGKVLATDVPTRMGGKDAAPQPVEHLLAALVGCEQATAVFVGRAMRPRLHVQRVDFELEAERDDRGATALPLDAAPPAPAMLQAVRGVARVVAQRWAPKGQQAPPARQEDIDELARHVKARCPVAALVSASGCELDVQWVLVTE